MSETSTVQPQHSVGDGSFVQLQQNQHEAEINHLRVESAAKQKVTTFLTLLVVTRTLYALLYRL